MVMGGMGRMGIMGGMGEEYALRGRGCAEIESANPGGLALSGKSKTVHCRS
jgi:hypothetical protein